MYIQVSMCVEARGQFQLSFSTLLSYFWNNLSLPLLFSLSYSCLWLTFQLHWLTSEPLELPISPSPQCWSQNHTWCQAQLFGDMVLGMQTLDLMLMWRALYPLPYLPRHCFKYISYQYHKMKWSNRIRGLHTIDLSCGPEHTICLPIRSSTIKYSKCKIYLIVWLMKLNKPTFIHLNSDVKV